MKILSDKDVSKVLEDVTRDTLLKVYQPHLLESLRKLSQTPESLPGRIVQASTTRSSDSTHLFMPSVAPSEVGLKVITGGPTNSKKGLGFVGCVLVLDEHDGSLLGVLNGKTLTAFRTALASSIPMVRVLDPFECEILPQVSVFGSGLQAYWHAKLTVILYGDKIQTINLINKSLHNAEVLQQTLAKEFPNKSFTVLSYADESQAEDVHRAVYHSSIILGCLPSTEAVIKKSFLNPDKNVPKYINLIGSYKPHMLELDSEVIHSEFNDGTRIIVDSKEHCLHESGELVQSKRTAENLIDIAELCSQGSGGSVRVTSRSNITISKLVGLATMDVSIGKLLLRRSHGGVEIGEF
ncbi:hypothetical protein PSN45_004556 [Yamadazyma tenuis]|uniref:NAD(P)-binding protein n=1 Tax=Candida tenuis (strain ATCC 10573 / BCRC 21748 / CBS 615 / JCM 9827 / NBRC 10315 / NRRL Y-1498 / VKM Y-70) TaxID=590646 RepID=G3B5A1_CANTC|nr:uncharacterized protein CANTEDRAFT_106103 [Yamadazyma tenuis ATCC 10573]EGV63168.1 hypothetical protein CANTEDRAFT_106103 [Yamadazyma tenuis ATCC 10573]WEJ97010.1 hypothetical protein PSN45_004556 [Yamadazyma tenuis]